MKYGYAYLAQNCCRPPAPLPALKAENTVSVRSMVRRADMLLIPARTFPDTDSVLEHVLFALRHEGIDLRILSGVLPGISGQEIAAVVRGTPSGSLARRLGFLWEHFSGRKLQDVRPTGAYVPLFDPKKYFTVPGPRDARWHVEFNGLGSWKWCATVRKTDRIQTAVARDLLGETRQWFESIGLLKAERAMGWAYLNETRGSFELERETIAGNKQERFVALLQHAHEQHAFSEDWLCDLQNRIVSNPFLQAYAYRTDQNWLSSGNFGAGSVTYVPPSPDCLDELMTGWLQAMERLVPGTDPIVAAAAISFGFVYLHPFMDGNGRLSRFLIHEELCRSGRLGPGELLPVSVAMKAHEEAYLKALTAFSSPMRQEWSVIETLGSPPFEFEFLGRPDDYRYWDATVQTEFLFEMIEEALQVHLKEEVDRLARFDRLDAAVNDRFDIRQACRHDLVNNVIHNGGRLSGKIRKRLADEVEVEALDWIDRNAASILAGEDADETDDG